MAQIPKRNRRVRLRVRPLVRPHSAPAGSERPGGATDSPYAPVGGPWYGHALAFLALVGVTCLLYRADLGLGFFHLDDPTYVSNNPWIKDINSQNLRRILAEPYFANYSPAHLFSYLLDYSFAGENPRAFHLSSNLWAGWVAGWVYLLGLILLKPASGKLPHPLPHPSTGWRRVFRPGQGQSMMMAFLAALLFAVHPAHVEAVAWISSRKDLVAAAFTLPSLAAYLLYRRGRARWLWYAASMILFLLGIAGKQSVAVFPGILMLFDLLVERRWHYSLLLDKLPYFLAAAWFALRTMDAQPSTRQALDFYVIGHSTLHNLWLLTGLGSYVLAHPPPDADAPWLFKALCILIPLGIAALPFMPRRRLPGMVACLIGWTLLALVPSQVLSFIHPVADRYLFFPSVPVVFLLAWLARRGGASLNPGTRLIGPALLLCLALLWAGRTQLYLREWQDPRSVWFAAQAKSDDPLVHLYLGSHYQDQADLLPGLSPDTNSPPPSAAALASAFWNDDPRLAALLAEWASKPSRPGPQTLAYQAALREAAHGQLELALKRSGSRLLPNLHFRLGKVALDSRDLDRARLEFGQAAEQARGHTSPEVREELAVRSHYALGLVEWQARNYPEALRWLRLAEEEQTQAGRRYIPTLEQDRQRLENIRPPGTP